MNKQQTLFKNYGTNPTLDFFFEVQEEAKKFQINELPIGISANRSNKYWNIYVEYINRINMNVLKEFIKCNKDTIKLYNKDYDEDLICPSNQTVLFSVYSEESLIALLNFLKHYNCSLPTHYIQNIKTNRHKCTEKVNTKHYIYTEVPCAIIDNLGNKRVCSANSYVIVDENGHVLNLMKEDFNEKFDIYD